jgi:hypothetical protein
MKAFHAAQSGQNLRPPPLQMQDVFGFVTCVVTYGVSVESQSFCLRQCHFFIPYQIAYRNSFL